MAIYQLTNEGYVIRDGDVRISTVDTAEFPNTNEHYLACRNWLAAQFRIYRTPTPAGGTYSGPGGTGGAGCGGGGSSGANDGGAGGVMGGGGGSGYSAGGGPGGAGGVLIEWSA